MYKRKNNSRKKITLGNRKDQIRIAEFSVSNFFRKFFLLFFFCGLLKLSQTVAAANFSFSEQLLSHNKEAESLSENDRYMEVSGRITTDKDEPLDNVFIIGTKGILDISDAEGYFSLERVQEGEMLTFYRYGYEVFSLSSGEAAGNNKIVMQREAVPVEGLSINQQRRTISGTEYMRSLIPVAAELQGRNLPEILGDYPEINVTGTPLPGERQTVSILGHHTRHTLILLDGIPLNSPGQPYDISSIPADTIESIEIIRGGAGAYRGSGAIGGLISINTRQPLNRHEFSLIQAFGSFGLYKTAINLYQRFDNFGIGLYADRNSMKNNFTFYDDQGEKKEREYNDKFFQNLRLKVNSHIDGPNSLDPEFTYKLEIYDFDNKLPGPVNYEALYRDARLAGLSIHNNFTASLHSPRVTSRLTLYHHSNRTEYDNTRTPHSFFRIESRHQNDKAGLQLSAFMDKSAIPLRDIQLEYGREDFSYREKTNPDNSVPQKRQENYALAVRSQLMFSLAEFDWNNDLSCRLEYWSRSSDSPENGKEDRWNSFISWRYDSAFTFYFPLHFSFGGGFSNNNSLPSFYDLYWKGDSQTTGNPELKAEESINMYAFGEMSFNNFEPRIEYHHSRVTNLIHWYRSVTGWKPGNIAAAEISSLKLSAEYNFSEFISFSASWLKTDALNKSRDSDGTADDLYGKKLIYTPEQNLNLSLTLRHNTLLRRDGTCPVFWRISHSYTGRQWSTPDQLVEPISAYQLTDTEIGMTFSKLKLNWQFSLMLKNIFDTRYEIYAYNPQPGFNWLFNLKINYTKAQ